MTDNVTDKSPPARGGHPAVGRVLDELSDQGTLATCAAAESETVYNTRD